MSSSGEHGEADGGGGLPPVIIEPRLDAAEMGVLSFLTAEFFFFGALVFTYTFYSGAIPSGPMPQEVLTRIGPTASVICMVVSGVTLWVGVRAAGQERRAIYVASLAITILLAIAFIVVTGMDWYDLIVNRHFRPRTNLFSSNFYGLVGFHVLHAAAGVVALLCLLTLAPGAFGRVGYAKGARLVAWYWYFVVGVAVAVYVVVYYGY